MLLMGDEVGRTQDGNNNAYCQDNEIAWLEWKDINQRDRAFMEFVLGVIRLRKRYRLLRSGSFLHGEAIDDKGTRNVVWYRPGRPGDGRCGLDRPAGKGGRRAALRRHDAADDPGEPLSRADRLQASGREPGRGAGSFASTPEAAPSTRPTAASPPSNQSGWKGGRSCSWPERSGDGPLPFPQILGGRTGGRRDPLPALGAVGAGAVAAHRRGERDMPMRRTGDGWFEVETDAIRPGDGYSFVLADGIGGERSRRARADAGVNGPSRLVDPLAYRMADAGLARPSAGRGGDLRAASRRLLARGHVRGRRTPARSSRRNRRDRDRADAGRAVRRRARLGL